MDKPDVDLITGLAPAIAIEQKTTSKNPRSTVATQTEVYDHLRLLYAPHWQDDFACERRNGDEGFAPLGRRSLARAT